MCHKHEENFIEFLFSLNELHFRVLKELVEENPLAVIITNLWEKWGSKQLENNKYSAPIFKKMAKKEETEINQPDFNTCEVTWEIY